MIEVLLEVFLNYVNFLAKYVGPALQVIAVIELFIQRFRMQMEMQN